MLTETQISNFKKILNDRFFEVREEIRLELLNSDDQTYIELAGQVHDTAEASVADLLLICSWRILTGISGKSGI